MPQHRPFLHSTKYLTVMFVIIACCLFTVFAFQPDPCYNYESDSDLSIEDAAGLIVLTQSGLGKYIDILLDDIIACISELVIDDVHDEAHISSLLTVDFDITDIAFEEFSVQDIDVSFQDPYITGSISDASAKIKFFWDYSELQWPYIGDSGWGEAELSDFSILFSFNLTMDPNCSTYDVNLPPIQLSVGNVDITLHGGASWLYDLILDLLTDVIVDILIDPLSVLLHDPLQQDLTDFFAVNPIEDIGPPGGQTLLVDLRFPAVPLFGNGWMGLPAVCRFETLEEEGMKPWEEALPTLPDIQSEAAIQVFLGMAVFNSQFDTFFRTSLLAGTITADNAGDYAALLATDVLSAFIPGLSDFPGQSIGLNLTANSVPTIEAQPVAMFVNVSGSLDILLNDTVLASLSVSYGLACIPVIETVEFYWGNSTCPFLSCTDYNQTAYVASSDIGEIDITRDLYQLLSVVGSEAVAPAITDLTSEYAIQIPASYIDPDMVSTIIHVDSGFVEYNVDLTPKQP